MTISHEYKILHMPRQLCCRGMCKICSNHCIKLWTRAKRNVHWIEIIMKKLLVTSPLDPDGSHVSSTWVTRLGDKLGPALTPIGTPLPLCDRWGSDSTRDKAMWQYSWDNKLWQGTRGQFQYKDHHSEHRNVKWCYDCLILIFARHLERACL